jgi:flagellar FliL protein
MAAKAKSAKIEEEAADSEPGEGEPAPAKRRLSLKLMLIAGAALLVVLGGGGTAAYFMLGKSDVAVAVPLKPAVFFEVPEVLVNLSTTGTDRTQYLKVKIVLELPDATLTPQIQATMPRVMDAFQTYLRELRASDLEGSAGLYRLKEELTRRVNAAIAPHRIVAVLFKEIVVQ